MKELFQAIYSFVNEHPLETTGIAISVFAIALQLRGSYEIKKVITTNKW
jgi:hypothetical protein